MSAHDGLHSGRGGTGIAARERRVRPAGQDSLARCTKAGVVVAGDELNPAHSSPNEIVEKRPPMNFGFGEGDGDARVSVMIKRDFLSIFDHRG